MNLPRPHKHLVIVLGLVLPFAVLPPLTAWSADRLAKAGAMRWQAFASLLAPKDETHAASSSELPESSESFEPMADVPVFVTTARVAGDRVARPKPRRIFVGPAMIRRAIPLSARPRSTWTDRNGDRPAGMLIQSPGVLSGTIQPGDILFEAEGRPITSFEQLVSVVGQAYQRKAKYLSGRLDRKGETWSVTVEPGW